MEFFNAASSDSLKLKLLTASKDKSGSILFYLIFDGCEIEKLENIFDLASRLSVDLNREFINIKAITDDTSPIHSICHYVAESIRLDSTGKTVLDAIEKFRLRDPEFCISETDSGSLKWGLTYQAGLPSFAEQELCKRVEKLMTPAQSRSVA